MKRQCLGENNFVRTVLSPLIARIQLQLFEVGAVILAVAIGDAGKGEDRFPEVVRQWIDNRHAVDAVLKQMTKTAERAMELLLTQPEDATR